MVKWKRIILSNRIESRLFVCPFYKDLWKSFECQSLVVYHDIQPKLCLLMWHFFFFFFFTTSPITQCWCLAQYIGHEEHTIPVFERSRVAIATFNSTICQDMCLAYSWQSECQGTKLLGFWEEDAACKNCCPMNFNNMQWQLTAQPALVVQASLCPKEQCLVHRKGCSWWWLMGASPANPMHCDHQGMQFET